MESITSSLAYTAAVTYAAKMSTTQTDSSIQGILGGLYFGVGKCGVDGTRRYDERTRWSKNVIL